MGRQQPGLQYLTAPNIGNSDKPEKARTNQPRGFLSTHRLQERRDRTK